MLSKLNYLVLVKGFLIWISTLLGAIVVKDTFKYLLIAIKANPSFIYYFENCIYLISIFLLSRILFQNQLIKNQEKISISVWTNLIILIIYLIVKFVVTIFIVNYFLTNECSKYFDFTNRNLAIIRIDNYNDILKYIMFGISIFSLKRFPSTSTGQGGI